MRVKGPLVAGSALLLAALLVLGSSSALASRSIHVRHRLQVTGYASDWTSPSIVDAQASSLTTLGVDGVDVALAGNDVASPSTSALQLLAAGHADGLKVELLVANSAVPGTSTAVAARLLTSPAHRSSVVGKLTRIVRLEGWDGITVDIEAMIARDAAGLVAFVAELREKLPRRDQLAVDVSATPALAEYPQIGYHLASLSRLADVVLMAYDENGPWSGPGPIGGLPWQRAAVAAVRHDVPASRLVLGVAAYGYTWPKGADLHHGVAVTDAQARRLAASSHKHPRWIASQGEWTVRLRNGTVLWWSDVRSYVLRRRMATGDGLAGLAVWQLAFSDPLPER